ncbi:MAG: hypothetical protein AAB401_23625 [Acidobacteriota bacterium]
MTTESAKLADAKKKVSKKIRRGQNETKRDHKDKKRDQNDEMRAQICLSSVIKPAFAQPDK